MSATKIERTVRIDAPAEDVWTVLADLEGIDRWFVPIERAELEGEPGKGAVRRCGFVEGGNITEHVTEWDEGRSLAYSIEGDLPVASCQSRFALEEAGGAATEVSVVNTFTPAGASPEEAVGQMEETAEFLLQALKHHVETGEVLQPPQE